MGGPQSDRPVHHATLDRLVTAGREALPATLVPADRHQFGRPFQPGHHRLESLHARRMAADMPDHVRPGEGRPVAGQAVEAEGRVSLQEAVREAGVRFRQFRAAGVFGGSASPGLA